MARRMNGLNLQTKALQGGVYWLIGFMRAMMIKTSPQLDVADRVYLCLPWNPECPKYADSILLGIRQRQTGFS
jgi:hypothetical protein